METKNLIPKEKFILNADDFGRSSKANANILSLAKSGKLDRVSVLITRNISAIETENLLQTKVKIDLHLDLPSKNRIRGQGQRSNALKGSLIFLWKYLSQQISPCKMEREWENQIVKFVEIFGHQPDGLNSHQHIHFFPPYFRILVQLAQKYKIGFIRFGKSGLLDSQNITYQILCQLHKKNKRLFSASSLNSSDYMASLDWTQPQTRNFTAFLDKLPAGKIELVCHPERESEFEFIKKYF